VPESEMDKLNRPGANLRGDLNPASGPPLEQFEPSGLPAGSMQFSQLLQDFLRMFGSQPLGSEGMPVTKDPSGELQRELRFDTDRVWGATVRAHSYGWARFAVKMQHILAACMDDRRLMVLSGEDNMPIFLEVGREIFTGTINAWPQPESQVLESRQEKQNRILALVNNPSGPLITPQQALEALNYPDLIRATRPGGPAYAMQERENLELLLGQDPQVLQEHDHAAHLACLKRFQQTVYYRDLDPATQERFRMHALWHEMLASEEMVRQGQMAQLTAARLQPPPPASPPAPGNGAPVAPAGPGAAAPAGADPQRMALVR
jgi:hypothetical protein